MAFLAPYTHFVTTYGDVARYAAVKTTGWMQGQGKQRMNLTDQLGALESSLDELILASASIPAI
ncbi:MAG: hypothetical protein CBARDCOR_5706 [uncultured Caballeronia sp.]|nr:MAG: hypothetical protein CBARDCOR_5706 [uncultured Caballeronia sp.]